MGSGDQARPLDEIRENPFTGGDLSQLAAYQGAPEELCQYRQILVVHSRFFEEKLCDKWVRQQRYVGPYVVEIAYRDDIGVYIETLKLMYCTDLRKRLMKAEAQVVDEMMKDNTICLVDELFLECQNESQDDQAEEGNDGKRAYWQCLALYGRLRDQGIAVHQWWNWEMISRELNGSAQHYMEG